MYAALSTNLRHHVTLRARFSLIRIVPSLALLMCFMAINASAQSTLLLGLTNTVWKYETNGLLSAGLAGWQNDDYDDSAWPSGRALLSFEDNAAIIPNIGTRLNRYMPGSSSVQVTTFWF